MGKKLGASETNAAMIASLCRTSVDGEHDNIEKLSKQEATNVGRLDAQIRCRRGGMPVCRILDIASRPSTPRPRSRIRRCRGPGSSTKQPSRSPPASAQILGHPSLAASPHTPPVPDLRTTFQNSLDSAPKSSPTSSTVADSRQEVTVSTWFRIRLAPWRISISFAARSRWCSALDSDNGRILFIYIIYTHLNKYIFNVCWFVCLCV